MSTPNNKLPSIKKNIIYRALYDVLALITPFITTPYISRVLGADGIGIYSYSFSIMSFFTLFAALGTSTYGAREIAVHRDDKVEMSQRFWEIEILTIITSSFCLLLWIILSLNYHEYRVYLFALIPVLLGTMFDINWFFTGNEKILVTVSINSFIKLLGIVLLFLLIKDKHDLLIYTVLNSMITLLGSLSMWPFLMRMINRIDLSTIRLSKHFKETLIYFIPTIATSIYTILDKTLIGIITHDNFQNGYYEQASKLIRIIKSVVFSSLNIAVGARISYLFSLSKLDEIKNKIYRSLDLIFLLGFGCTFGLIAIANNFVPLFFGDGFEPVINLIYLMSPLIIIIGISNCLGSQYFTPSGQREKSAKVIVIGAIINLTLNVILISHFGMYGAVISSVLSESVITIAYVMLSNGYASFYILFRLSWKRLVAGCLMVVVVIWFGSLHGIPAIVQLVLQIVLGVIIYVLALFIFKDDLLLYLGKTIINYIMGMKKKVKS